MLEMSLYAFRVAEGMDCRDEANTLEQLESVASRTASSATI